MKAPDDISEYEDGSRSDAAHYDDEGGTGFSDADSLSSVEGEFGKLATKETTGGLKDLLRGRNVYLVRHGKSTKAPKDEDRKLSPLGEKQCASFLSTYSAELERVVYAFSSPVVRTVATANFLGFPDPVRVPYLYFGNYYTEEMVELDNELGYAPLAEYLQANEGKGEDIYGPVRTRLGLDLGAALSKELEKAKKVGEWEGDLIIITHGTTISLMAMEILRAIKAGIGEGKDGEGNESVCPEEDKILAFNVGEVEGFEVSSDGKVRLLRNEESEAPTGKNADSVGEGK